MEIGKSSQHDLGSPVKSGKPGLYLLHLFAQVGVGEHYAFGYPCCSSRVLIHGHILKTQLNGWRVRLVSGDALLPCKHIRRRFDIGSELFLLGHEREKEIFGEGKIITDRCIHDLLDLGFWPEINHAVCQKIKGDQRLGPGIIELMIELVVGIEGIVHDRDRTDLQYGKIGNNAGDQIGQEGSLRHPLA